MAIKLASIVEAIESQDGKYPIMAEICTHVFSPNRETELSDSGIASIAKKVASYFENSDFELEEMEDDWNKLSSNLAEHAFFLDWLFSATYNECCNWIYRDDSPLLIISSEIYGDDYDYARYDEQPYEDNWEIFGKYLSSRR